MLVGTQGRRGSKFDGTGNAFLGAVRGVRGDRQDYTKPFGQGRYN